MLKKPLTEDDLIELEIEPPPVADVNASSDTTELRDASAMADPENAHSPMSPDDHVSEQHPGLHTDGHTTGGPTPSS